MEHITSSLKSAQTRLILYLQSGYVFAAVAIAAGLLIASATLAASHPALGEIVEATIITAGAYLLAFGLVGFGSYIAWNFTRSAALVWREEILPAAAESVRQLAPGTVVPAFDFDLSPDVLIVSRPGETKEQFSARLEQARQRITPACWVVMLEFQNPVGAIYTHGGAPDLVFTREDAPFQADGFSRVAPEDARFVDETPADFLRYVERFSFLFREWSPRKKVAVSPDRAGRTVLEIVAPCLLPLLLFFASGIFAQNAAQVATALGTRIREIPAAGSELTYEFETKEFSRVADGRRDYVALLKAAPMYRDNRGGRFVALYVNGAVIAKGEQVQAIAQRDEMRPRSFVKTDEPVGYSMPDSLELVGTLDRARERVSFYESEFWAAIRPTWAFVMFCFWALFPFLCVIGLVLWFWARLSASEEMPGIHWHSSRGLVILVGSAWTVLIINAMLTVVYWELPTVPFLISVAGIGLFAWKTAAWIVPNLNAKPGGRTAYMTNRNQPLLGG